MFCGHYIHNESCGIMTATESCRLWHHTCCQLQSCSCLSEHRHTHRQTDRMCTSTKPEAYNLLLVARQFGGIAPAGAEDDKADKKRRRRRRSKAADADVEQKWGFLSELDAADQSWLHFALYSAYQSQRYCWHCTCIH